MFSLFKKTSLIGLLFPIAVFAYQSPGRSQGYVSDFANLLSTQSRSAIEAELSAFEKATGNQVAAVTIKNLGGDTVENFAVSLFKDWGIGKKDKDNGVLILVAAEDHKMRIEVGYGLEGSLTDSQSGSIIKNIMTPAFRAGDFSGGINGAVNAVIADISPGYASGTGIAAPPSAQPSGGFVWDSSSVSFFIFFIPIWLASVLARSKSWWAGGVLGGISGVVIGFIYGFFYFGIAAIVLLIPLGLLFDFLVSRVYVKSTAGGRRPPWWIGGGGFGDRGGGSGFGGFGGFGGGSSGGGGASGSW